ncbi:BRCT domain-containing protein [Cunninghamella echinulata]|nr:BRCT domain-containing protein [Cunninghamella echinulata]
MQEFWELENNILNKYGITEPEPPKVRVKNITQTSLILEWDPLVLHTASLRSLDIFKNKTKLAQHIPGDVNFIKLSGLDVDHEYEFHIAIKTTAGKYESNKVTARTHRMENLTGIRVAFGNFENAQATLIDLKNLLETMGATWTDEVNHETTHLIAQVPGDRNYDTAVKYSIPIVKPEWLIQCDRNKKIQPALPYYIVSVPTNE